ncbi:MAG: hypothetical protein QOH39_3403 [Verrucomicrobiota bacterium]|jgi:DNA-binding Lrp family transcriptional regulator
MRRLEDGEQSRSSDLPGLEYLADESFPPADKAAAVLRVLRQVAIDGRCSKGLPFYPIRAVARHFGLPPTTVTRLYEQLKTEGILGSIWGSKTIIEPKQLDNDIRLRAIVALPLPWRAFSAVPTYRHFVRSMQRSLARERFGSQVIFYDETLLDVSTLTDALLECGSDLVIWLMPPARMSNSISRLKDRGIRSITIADELPINGEAGYYLSWQDAVMEGLATWKRAGSSRVFVIRGAESNCSSSLRSLRSCLARVGFPFELRNREELNTDQLSADSNGSSPGVVLLSPESVIHFAQAGLGVSQNLQRHRRVLFIHGGVDLPFQTDLSRSFDSIEFDWRSIARCIVRDLVVSRCTNDVDRQTIFKGKWVKGIRPEASRSS